MLAPAIAVRRTVARRQRAVARSPNITTKTVAATARDRHGLPAGFSEAQLEAALRADFERFLGELGPDFYLRRTQQPLVIDGRYHAVDLELYCRAIPCIVLVDLKVGPFEDRYVGQMNKYVNYYRERVPSYPWEKPPVGLIICASAGREEVRYALGGLEERIFVAEYRRTLAARC
jgi:hypothetical protein